jgi:hypothetical protein
VRARELLFGVARVDALDLADLAGGRQVLDDGVEEELDADVAEGRAAQDRVAAALDGALAEGGADLVGGDGALVVEVFVGEVVVHLGRALHEFVVPFLDLVGHVLGDGLLGDDRALLVGVEVEGLHVHQVDDALELVALADGVLDGDPVGAQAALDGPEAELEIAAELVHLVDKAQARDAVAVGLAPDRLALGLDALLAVEDGDRAVEHAQRALDLDREVHVAGRVDQVDLVLAALVLPGAGGRGGLDGDAALLLILQEVHGGGALMDLAHLVGLAGVEKDALGDRGLAGVDVGADADVADVGEVGGHGWSLLVLKSWHRVVSGIPWACVFGNRRAARKWPWVG